MAITRGGFAQGNGTGSSVQTDAFSADPVAGDGVVVVIVQDLSTSEVLSGVTDNATGNTYAITPGELVDDGVRRIYICRAVNVNTTAGFRVTATFTGSTGGVRMLARAYTDMHLTAPDGISGGQIQSNPGTGSNAVQTGNLNSGNPPAEDGHLVIAVHFRGSGVDDWTVGPGYSLIAQSFGAGYLFQDLIQTTAAVVNAQCTNDPGTGGFYSAAATFKPIGGGSPYTLTADPGAVVITGTDATLTPTNRTLAAEAGTVTIAGTAVSFHSVVLGDSGEFLITGTDANLIHNTPGEYNLVADSGSFSLSGTAAGLIFARELAAATRAFLITGQEVNLNWSEESDEGGLTNTATLTDVLTII